MKVGIMQPYFLPYIGYFQLMNAVDAFVVYDNIQFTKKGWIRHNRMLMNGKDAKFSIPIKKDSDYLDVVDRQLADNYLEDAQKTLRKIQASYRKAPCFDEVMPLVEQCFLCEKQNLFEFIYHSLHLIKEYLGIDTQFAISSAIDIDHQLKSQDKVLAICRQMGADMYINPIGGLKLYRHSDFEKEGVELNFLQTNSFEYRQFNHPFVPYLSIIDLLFFNPKDKYNRILDEFTLIKQLSEVSDKSAIQEVD